MSRGGRRAGAGRPPGARNKRTAEALALLEQSGVDPLRELVRLADESEKRGDLDVARKCWASLVGYRYSKPAGNIPTPPPASAPVVELPSWWRPGRAS